MVDHIIQSDLPRWERRQANNLTEGSSHVTVVPCFPGQRLSLLEISVFANTTDENIYFISLDPDLNALYFNDFGFTIPANAGRFFVPKRPYTIPIGDSFIISRDTFHPITGWIRFHRTPLSLEPTLASWLLADSPLAYWRLGEASGSLAVDATGHGYDGTYETVTLGAAGLTSDPDTAVVLSPTNGIVRSVRDIAFEIQSFTIDAWVKMTAGNLSTIFSHANAALDRGFSWSINTDSMRFTIHTAGGDLDAVSSPALSLNEAHHIAVVYDNRNFSFYVNAVIGSGGTFGQDIPFTADTRTTIGRNPGPGNGFTGTLDEVTFLDRALTSAQIFNRYKAAFI